ncbi:MAG TPA: PAS domain S-box protein [Candidatus Kapabacteria bacterium]|nr:PAS domain S-box protein [Candidatus Kapabacteria bacterium]
MVTTPRSSAVRYAIAIAAIAACVLVQMATWPLLEPTPYQVFYLAVGVIAWRYGSGPALLAIALGLLSVDYLFHPPLYRLDFGVEAIGPVLFSTLAALTIARLGAISHRTREELTEAHDALEQRVHERTLELERKNAELLRENTERERAQEALRRSERHSRLINENALDVITILGPDGSILYASQSVERVLGYRADELVGTNAFERVHAEDLAGVTEVFSMAIEQLGTTRSVQLRFRHMDGSWRVLEVVGRNLLDDPVVAGVLLSSRDVTDRWEAERSLQQQQEFLSAVLENAQDAIVAFDAEGRLTFFNRAARDIYPSARLSIPVQEWIGEYETYDADGVARLETAQIPLVRAVHGEQFRDVGMTIHGADGEAHTLLASGRPINDLSGRRLGAVVVAHDITELQRAEREREKRILEQTARRAGEEQQRRLEFLVSAGATLGESLEFERTLSSVARLAVGVLADWCVVDVLDESGTPQRIAVRHVDPERETLARELMRFPPDPAKSLGVPKVLRSGVPELIEDVTEEFLSTAARSPEHHSIVERLGTRSAMFVPLVAHERVVGAISFFRSGDRRYDEADLALALELARRCAHAIESARLYQSERRTRALAERAAERTAQLQSITAAFGEALTTQQVADVMIDLGLPIVGGAAGSLAIIADSGHELEIVRSAGYPTAALLRWTRFSIDTPVPIAEAVGTGTPLFIVSREELAAAYPHLESIIETPHEGWAAVPLFAEERIIGAVGISFDDPTGVVFEPENRQMILALARQCGQALDRARLYEAERRARAEAEQARRSLGAIAEASAVLSAQLDFHATLRSIARLAVPMLADTCVVDVLEPEGTMRRVAVAGANHRTEQLLVEMMKRYPTGSRESLRYEVLDTGRPILVAETDENWIRRVAVDEGHASMLRELGQRSYLYLPLRARGRTFGAMGLASLDGRRRFDEGDIPSSQEIALRAAVALDNARLYEEANEANRAKDEFLATVSHEVRTPLNAILGWSQMLREGTLDEATASHAVEAIERNARVQAQIIEDILDISRVIAGKLRLEPRRIEIAPVVAAALDAVRPSADTASVALSADVPAGLPSLVADPGRLQQVLWNLLLNAVKFTPAGGAVTLGVRTTSTEVEFTVTDTGAGIDPEFLPFVFERFRQAEGGSGRRHGGLGLGLAIVRAIVQTHGGTVAAASEGLGRGSSFTVRLPLPARELATGAREAIAGEPASIDESRALLGLRIVIVDDEADARDLLTLTLTRNGAEVRCAGCASDALAIIEEWHPDLLVSDLAMPVEDGFSLVERLRGLSSDNGGTMPAIALTAYARLEDRERAIAAGFQEHLAKPVDPQRLVRVLASLAGRPSEYDA